MLAKTEQLVSTTAMLVAKRGFLVLLIRKKYTKVIKS